MELTRYEAARRALAEAHRVDEVTVIKDKAEALRLYARQRADNALETMAAEIKLRAIRRIGELSRELEKAEGFKGNQHAEVVPTSGKNLKSQLLRDAGLSTSTAHRCEQIAEIPAKEFERYIETKTARRQPVSSKELTQVLGRKVRRKEKVERILKNNRPLDASLGIFNVILTDPPWQYRTVISESRRIENYYPTMSLEDIKRLPVQAITAPDAVLFLWATNPGLKEALEVLEAWGFEYRDHVMWMKPSIGPGHWIRQQHEVLLLGVKGNIPVPLPENRPASVIMAPRGRHSEKPEEAHLLIERAFPEFPKIELFSRGVRPGWVAWGNEVTDGSSEGTSCRSFSPPFHTPAVTLPADNATPDSHTLAVAWRYRMADDPAAGTLISKTGPIDRASVEASLRKQHGCEIIELEPCV
jgi:N6-adenosine-specific RNA methylase IME4